VALGGVVYFATVLLIAGVAGQSSARGRENVPAYVFALSTVALAFVLYLGWASLFKLNTVCLLCATTYVAVIRALRHLGWATTFPMTSLPRRASTDVARLVRSPLGLDSVAGSRSAPLALLNGFRARRTPRRLRRRRPRRLCPPRRPRRRPRLTDQQKMDFLKWYEISPGDRPWSILEGAKVLVVKFNDYQCPPCRQSFLDYKPIIEKYRATGQLKFVPQALSARARVQHGCPGRSPRRVVRSGCRRGHGAVEGNRR
jgi:hypothetical protein